jgi:hypothetical protein
MSDTVPEKLPETSQLGDTMSAETRAPTAEPPASVGGAAVAGGVGATVWVSGKKINALWSINQNRNSWVSVAGVGWVKLANNSDSAVVALTMLGANAKLTQGTVNYRQESDNMIHEMYVW